MKKQLIFLCLVVVLALAAMGSLLLQNQPQQEQKSLLLKDFDANQLVSITLENAQGTLLELSNTEKGWQANVADLQRAYPVAKDKLSDFVSALSTVVKFEAKTSQVKNYAKLGLQDISNIDSQGTLVTLKTSNQQWQVLIGNLASSGAGHYARIPTENGSWLLNQTLDLPTEYVEWLKQPIFDFEVSKIQRVSMQGDAPWDIIQASSVDGQFQLADMPPSRQLKYAAVLDGFIDNLVGVRFDSLQSFDQAMWQTLDTESVLEIEIQSGIKLRATSATLNDEHYLLITSNDNDRQHYWSDVVYKVSSFSAGQLNKVIEDFLMPLENPDITNTAPSIDEGESPN